MDINENISYNLFFNFNELVRKQMKIHFSNWR